MNTQTLNSFEALCGLASKERWCWNLWCTTCGHTNFRYGFLELAAGKSPSHSTWIVNNRIFQHSGFSAQLGKFPRQYNQDQKEIITHICLNANLSAISESCHFPDWLGYLGLVLHHMKHSPSFRKMSQCWASQLGNMTPRDCTTYKRLSEISKGHEILNISDLEFCERELMRLNKRQL